GSANVTGADNVCLGYNAGASMIGSNNTSIGYYSDVDPSSAGYSNATAIGAGAIANCSNCMSLGNSSVSVGIGTTTPSSSYKFDVQGGSGTGVTVARFSGDIICNGIPTVSDARFKNNIQAINDSRNILMNLHPYRYEFDTSNYPQMNFRAGIQYGLLAQDLQQVLPSLVTDA